MLPSSNNNKLRNTHQANQKFTLSNTVQTGLNKVLHKVDNFQVESLEVLLINKHLTLLVTLDLKEITIDNLKMVETMEVSTMLEMKTRSILMLKDHNHNNHHLEVMMMMMKVMKHRHLLLLLDLHYQDHLTIKDQKDLE